MHTPHMLQDTLFTTTAPSPYREKNTRPSSARRLRDLPSVEHPLQRLHAVGANALSNAELLELILGAETTTFGRDLLAQFDGLRGLQRAALLMLMQVNGIGPARAARLKAAFELGRRLHDATANDANAARCIRSPEEAAQSLLSEMSLLEQEQMRVLLLNARNQLLTILTIYAGNINTCVIRMAELFREAVRQNVHSVIFAHNHPSGDPTPSPEDIRVTAEMIKAGQLLDIEVLDHLVIGGKRFVSLKERGLGFGGGDGSRAH